MSADIGRPNDWVRVVDAATGRATYCSASRGLALGEQPAEYAEPAGVADWVRVRDPGSGRSYYASASRASTSWEEPPGYTPARDWARVTDAGSGRVYYSSVVLGLASWDRPADFVAPDEPAAGAEPPPPPPPVVTALPVTSAAAALGALVVATAGAGAGAATVAVSPSSPEAAAARGTAIAPVLLADGLPDDFVECFDATAGTTYWSSALRRATAWQKPVRAAAAAPPSFGEHKHHHRHHHEQAGVVSPPPAAASPTLSGGGAQSGVGSPGASSGGALRSPAEQLEDAPVSAEASPPSKKAKKRVSVSDVLQISDAAEYDRRASPPPNTSALPDLPAAPIVSDDVDRMLAAGWDVEKLRGLAAAIARRQAEKISPPPPPPAFPRGADSPSERGGAGGGGGSSSDGVEARRVALREQIARVRDAIAAVTAAHASPGAAAAGAAGTASGGGHAAALEPRVDIDDMRVYRRHLVESLRTALVTATGVAVGKEHAARGHAARPATSGRHGGGATPDRGGHVGDGGRTLSRRSAERYVTVLWCAACVCGGGGMGGACAHVGAHASRRAADAQAARAAYGAA